MGDQIFQYRRLWGMSHPTHDVEEENIDKNLSEEIDR